MLLSAVYSPSPLYSQELVTAKTVNSQKRLGKVVMGVEAPPEAWGGNIYTLAKVRSLAQTVVDKNAAGLMLWSLQKQPEGAPSDNNPIIQLLK